MDNKSQKLNTALLVMDIHTAILGRLGENDAVKNLVRTLETAIIAARSAGIPVIYVVLGFRKGFPDISPDNKAFGAVKNGVSQYAGVTDPPVFHPSLAPKEGDIMVTKKRYSAFTGSDLDLILRSGKVQHLVMAGVSTSGVVLSTLREAADKDYHVSILSDGCADADPEVHSVLISKIFPRQAEIVTTDWWVEKINDDVVAG